MTTNLRKIVRTGAVTEISVTAPVLTVSRPGNSVSKLVSVPHCILKDPYADRSARVFTFSHN